MLQPAGHFRLQQKARPAVRAVSVVALDLLEGHLTLQLHVEGHEYLAQAAAGVRPQHRIAGAGAVGRGPLSPTGPRDLLGGKGGGCPQARQVCQRGTLRSLVLRDSGTGRRRPGPGTPTGRGRRCARFREPGGRAEPGQSACAGRPRTVPSAGQPGFREECGRRWSVRPVRPALVPAASPSPPPGPQCSQQGLAGDEAGVQGQQAKEQGAILCGR